MADTFISKELFSHVLEEQKTLNWDELEQDKIYKVINVKPTTGKYGPTAILTVIDKEENRRTCWAPSRMLNRLEENSGKTAYFISLGKRKENDKTYNQFDLIFK